MKNKTTITAKKNIIIHDIKKDGNNEEDQQKAKDENFAKDLLKDVANRSKPKYIERIGLQTTGKFRPIKVVFETEGQVKLKTRTMKNQKTANLYGQV